jgi:hypothetical protein
MKKVSIFRNRQTKLWKNFELLISHLDKCNISFKESSLEEEINLLSLNFFLVPENILPEFLKKNQEKFSFPARNILVCENFFYEVSEKYYFSHIYLDFPGSNQFKLDLENFLLPPFPNLKYYLKYYFSGFLAESVVHDINNPLTSIILNSQLISELADRGFQEGQLNKLNTFSLDSADKAATIGKNFISYIRYDIGENEFFNLADVLRHILSFSQPLFRKKQIEIKISETDILTYANLSDTNLLFIILFFVISKYVESGTELNVSFRKPFLLFELDKSPKNLTDLFYLMDIPKFLIEYGIKQILKDTNILLQLDGSKLLIKIPEGA